MKLKSIYEIADTLAPFALSKEYCERYGMHDNSGIQLDSGENIDSVLFALDLSEGAVKQAQSIGAKCIFTHHPAIFNPLYCISENNCASLLACAKSGISVISAHLNLDAAKCGIDENLMHGLGGAQEDALMDKLSGGGYGRVYCVKNSTVAELVKHIQNVFLTKRIVVYGDKPVHKIASFCGAGMDDRSVDFAIKQGADTIVSSDGKHHLIAACVEKGVNVLLIPHYSAELYGFKKFMENFAEKTKNAGVKCTFYTDERLL
ncbi:MAG: Nif3-like dinuclear metal center hexameric protein [Clostridia bacterium]|nr:Nif3-like dinuclear metal center hexameric protein [Clostridia bacterium]